MPRLGVKIERGRLPVRRNRVRLRMVIAGQSSPEEEALAVARQHADWGRQVRLGGCGVHLRARPRLAFHIPVVR